MRKILWLLFGFFTLVPSALAQEQGGGGTDPGENGGSEDSLQLYDPLQGADFFTVLNRIIDFLLLIAWPIAIVMTIWAGFLFITAGDSEEKVKKARTMLLYIVIGIAILIFSKGIISLVTNIITGN